MPSPRLLLGVEHDDGHAPATDWREPVATRAPCSRAFGAANFGRISRAASMSESSASTSMNTAYMACLLGSRDHAHHPRPPAGSARRRQPARPAVVEQPLRCRWDWIEARRGFLESSMEDSPCPGNPRRPGPRPGRLGSRWSFREEDGTPSWAWRQDGKCVVHASPRVAMPSTTSKIACVVSRTTRSAPPSLRRGRVLSLRVALARGQRADVELLDFGDVAATSRSAVDVDRGHVRDGHGVGGAVTAGVDRPPSR